MRETSKQSKGGKNIVVLTACAFLLVLGGVFVANLFYQPPDISVSERRYLADFPALFVTRRGGGEEKTVLNPEFADQFETWAMDSFLTRDAFRGIKANALFYLFRQGDNNGIYRAGGHIGKLETLNERSVLRAGEKMAALQSLLPDGARVWYSVVPDKGFYLSRDTGVRLPAIDYGQVMGLLAQSLGEEGYIRLMNDLGADDYYRTDLHWAQDRMENVLVALGNAMGFGERLETVFQAHVMEPFYGVYHGQAALSLPGEAMTYLTSAAIDGAVVRYMNTSTMELEEGAMYLTDRFYGIDPYDLFLGGAQPIITIENPNGQTERELILFRDSFGSSLAPLLTSAYGKITLIDLRYVDSRLLDTVVDFGQAPDVLFLYSMQILNQSDTLLVSGLT